MTIFLVFFGVSLVDAVATRNWMRAAFWMLIAIVFAAADWVGHRNTRRNDVTR